MFRPLRDFLLVEPLERKKSSIIFVVGHEEPNLGIVRAVGPGKMNKRGQLGSVESKVGDVVRFGTTADYLKYPQITLRGKEYLLLQDADVCFVEMEEEHAA